MADCPHPEFVAHVDVDRLAMSDEALDRDEIKGFRASVRIECAECGGRFGFRTDGVVGDLPNRPACSPDALELRAPLISPSELTLLGPLAAIKVGDGMLGYQIRTREAE